MNAHTRSLTAAGIVNALRPLTSAYGGKDRFGVPMRPRHTVRIGDRYYIVNDTTLASLRAGHSPDALGLEPVEPEEI
jgi:hypothetical protein